MHSQILSEDNSDQSGSIHTKCDSLQSWIICFVNFASGFVCFGTHCNFGLIHQFLVIKYNCGNALTGKKYHFCRV